MTPTVLVPDHLISPDTVHVGDFIVNPKAPEENVYAFDSALFSDSDILSTTETNVNVTFSDTRQSGLHSVLTKLFSIRFERNIHDAFELVSTNTTTTRIKNSSSLFRKACESSDAKQWIEDAIGNGEDVYFVVGLIKVTDAKYRYNSAKLKKFSTGAVIPTSLVVTAGLGGVPVPLTDILNVGVTGGTAGQRAQDTQFDAIGERIFGLQCRKVKFEYFNRNVDKATLKKGVWWELPVTREVRRTVEGQEEEEEDLVQAIVSDMDEEFGASASKLDGGLCETDAAVYFY